MLCIKEIGGIRLDLYELPERVTQTYTYFNNKERENHLIAG